ncbi:MAG: LAGLIDADG family homing endonuclease [Patescibacteria group bacterium]
MKSRNNSEIVIWSSDIAYGIGLVVSDGNLSKDGRHICFKSADLELINNFKQAFCITNHVGKSARGGETEKRYYYTQFSNIKLYNYLNIIGITPNKSKTIKKVDIPEEYFHDFLRGVFDGDGTFYTFWDKRWVQSFGFQISFASASLYFISWLKEMLHQLYNVNDFIRQGDGVYNLRYVKGDSRTLFAKMYNTSRSLFLRRKHDKIRGALSFDDTLKRKRNLKLNDAAVAQW